MQSYKSFCKFEKEKHETMDILFELLPYIIAIIIFLVRIFGGNKETEETQPAPAQETLPKKSQPTQNKNTKSTLDDWLKQATKQFSELEKEIQKKLPATKQQAQPKKVLDIVNAEKGLTDEQRKGSQHFLPYQLHKERQSPFAKLLKNKDTLKQAIIVSEILNRKYF